MTESAGEDRPPSLAATRVSLSVPSSMFTRLLSELEPSVVTLERLSTASVDRVLSGSEFVGQEQQEPSNVPGIVSVRVSAVINGENSGATKQTNGVRILEGV